MIIVYETFVCKPGNASKMAKLFREWADVSKNKSKITVMTDMTGQYHRVVVATTYESLASYEEETKNMMQNQSPEEKAMMDKFSNMNEMYTSGSREIYKVW
jgi:hypothetical protein